MAPSGTHMPKVTQLASEGESLLHATPLVFSTAEGSPGKRTGKDERQMWHVLWMMETLV